MPPCDTADTYVCLRVFTSLDMSSRSSAISRVRRCLLSIKCGAFSGSSNKLNHLLTRAGGGHSPLSETMPGLAMPSPLAPLSATTTTSNAVSIKMIKVCKISCRQQCALCSHPLNCAAVASKGVCPQDTKHALVQDVCASQEVRTHTQGLSVSFLTVKAFQHRRVEL